MATMVETIRLVITGFQPFGDHEYNPSWDVAQAMAEVANTTPRLLPVTFMTAAQFARAHLTAARPIPLLFVHLGLAADRREICFERRARNERDGKADNIERLLPIKLPRRRALIPDERAERIALLDLAQMAQAFNAGADQDGLPTARISDDCGNYVCNALLYHSLRACESSRAQGHPAQAIFIHVPDVDPDRARRIGHHLARVITPASMTVSSI